ncbi:hypothetical protein NQ318_007468 [Aromia moschata]|uniref:U11/U12 small nuclear ribonucleoprotein 35 kDa protein n=1 Tax=Aromia moschata TaxID=1265417 RepID=A0AAV8WZP8_9CUCU|nr:hypothetical protein NQ318_007468 [Aromia moschata]
MTEEKQQEPKTEFWSRYAKVYDPIKVGSIDGTDVEPHDKAIERAINSKYVPNRHVKGNPECTIFVSRLNYKTTKDTIKDVFSRHRHGMPKGYAFIEYESEASAEEAYRLANRMVLEGSMIFVDFECERLLKGWKPRRLGGGFAGKKESGQLRFGGRDKPFKKPISLEIKEEEERRAQKSEIPKKGLEIAKEEFKVTEETFEVSEEDIKVSKENIEVT